MNKAQQQDVGILQVIVETYLFLVQVDTVIAIVKALRAGLIAVLVCSSSTENVTSGPEAATNRSSYGCTA